MSTAGRRARMRHPGRWLAALALGVAAAAATAQPGPSTAPAESPPGSDAPSPAKTPPRRFEGAIGLILVHRAAFGGSSDRGLRPELAGFLRWGRLTLSGAGGFTTRAQDDVERGLDTLLVERDRLRVNLALRFDPGRRESSSEQLDGMGNVRATLRARLGLRWQPAPQWSVSLNGNIDALGRGGGTVVNAGVSRQWPLAPGRRVILAASLNGASERYMQTWYGVTPEQSAASGYPVHDASAGLRDLGLSATWRADFDERWAGFAGLGATRALGPAAASPLVRQRDSVSLSVGLARRF